MLASKGGVQNCSILCDRAGVGLAGARERRDEGRIAAKGLRCRRERGRDAWCSGVDELLLGHHVSLRALRLREPLCTKPVQQVWPAKPGGQSAGTQVRRRERDWKPEPATQRDLHCFGCEQVWGIAGDGLEPRGGMRTGLGTQERAVIRWQRRQHHVVVRNAECCHPFLHSPGSAILVPLAPLQSLFCLFRRARARTSGWNRLRQFSTSATEPSGSP